MSAKVSIEEPLGQTLASKTTSVFGYPRDFLDNRFVYLVISPRARGLSIGINMNPDKFCNFDCIYCEVNRDDTLSPDRELDIGVMAAELEKTLFLIHSGQIRLRSPYSRLTADLLQLQHVAFSGDGEPTLCLEFAQAVQSVVHLRARKSHPYFKLALITNGTWLDLAPVVDGLQYFTRTDEIWIKLDAGTQAYMDQVNRSEVALEKIMHNTLELGRKRPIIIQSLFPSIDGQEPSSEEIAQFIGRLNELKTGGAQIAMVQIYSATRPTKHTECGHLSLNSLSLICRRVRAETGLKAEVF
jgi:wyosine [tRNA(Phe)-imidazoG37] synthetase (radical SAM superfamily)